MMDLMMKWGRAVKGQRIIEILDRTIPGWKFSSDGLEGSSSLAIVPMMQSTNHRR
jgi:hypothetical protein